MKDKVSHLHSNERRKLGSHLAGQGLKFSRAREAIFWEVMDAHGHFTAEELVKHCTSNKRGVSRATIYRCLKEMLEAGVIRETAFGEKHHHFEHVYDEKLHHHARCIHCYEVIEFPCLQEYKKYLLFLKRQDFHSLGHEVHFYGICKKCRGEKHEHKAFE